MYNVNVWKGWYLMKIHKKNGNKLNDSHFEEGTLYHIVPGNMGRVLDCRRTPGLIEEYNEDSAII